MCLYPRNICYPLERGGRPSERLASLRSHVGVPLGVSGAAKYTRNLQPQEERNLKRE